MKFNFLVVVTLLVSACANNPFSSYKSTSDQQLEQVYQGNLAQALAASSHPDMLYRMELGSLLRLENNYESSAAQFNLAYNYFGTWVDQWKNTTQGQLSDSLVANLINDNANDYPGKDYEKVFLSTYTALNYFNLHNYDYARVNVKRIAQTEQALKNYNRSLVAQAATEQAKNTQNQGGSYLSSKVASSSFAAQFYTQVNAPEVLALQNSYQNAFSNYVAAYIYETLKDASNARAGYLNALELSPSNQLIGQSLKNLDATKPLAPGYADVLIIEEVGHAPQIKSEEFSLPFNAKFFNNDNNANNVCLNSINLFFPRVVADTLNNVNYGFSLDQQNYSAYLMADTNLMLARYLHDQTAHIVARNVAAGLRNIASSQAVCASGGSLGSVLSLATTLGGVMLDRADARTWSLLPGKIYLNRVQLAYGTHVLSININGVVHKQRFEVTHAARILSFRVLGEQVYFTN